MTRSNEPKIVVVEEGEEYTGDQVALRFIEAEPKIVKVASEEGTTLGIDMAWSLTFLIVHVPDRYEWISFAKLRQRGTEDKAISPNHLTSGDKIALDLGADCQIDVGMFGKSPLLFIMDEADAVPYQVFKGIESV